MSLLWRDILDGLRARPGRSGLAFFAMAVGMAVLTALVALLDGLERKSRQLSRELGSDVVVILPGNGKPDQGLHMRHVELLRANYPRATVSAARQGHVSTPGGDGTLAVVAVEHEMADIRGWSLRSGGFFSADDQRAQRRYAVVTEALSRDWHWKVGAIVLLERIPYQVIGVVGTGGDALAGEYGDSRLVVGEKTVFVPVSAHVPWQSGRSQTAPLDAIYLRTGTDEPPQASLAGMRDLLAQPDVGLSEISWVIPLTLVHKVRDTQRSIGLTVGTVALLCMLLGGTTLSSLLVANVRERVAEIGLRRALGATRRDISTLFIAEGCAVTLSAAAAGIVLAYSALRWALPPSSTLPVALGAPAIGVPLIIAVLAGVLFSWWPARSAARIRPAEALRSD